MLPTIVTASLFTSIIIYDLYSYNHAAAPGHALFGVFSTLLIFFISQKVGDNVAWILLSFPFLLISISYLFNYLTLPIQKAMPLPLPKKCTCDYNYNNCNNDCNEELKPCNRLIKVKPIQTPTPIKPSDSKCIKSSLNTL